MQPLAVLSTPFLVVLVALLVVNPASCALTLSTNSYARNGQFVEFRWSGITPVQESDIIALIQTVPAQRATR